MSKAPQKSFSQRILSVVPYDLSPQAGGVKVHAENLNEALRRRGHEVLLVGPSSKPLDRPHTVRASNVLNIPANGSDNFLGLLVNPLRIRRILREFEPTLIHMHEPQMPLVSYWVHWLSPKVPKVATFHGYSEDPGLARSRTLSARCVLGGVRQGIAVSQAALEHARLSFSGSMSVIPNGVDTQLFFPDDLDEASPLRSPAPNKLRAVFVGRLNEPRKGLQVMLEVFFRAHQQGLELELHLVGDGRSAPPLPSHPALIHHNELDPQAFAQCLKQSDCLVAPAQGQESFGMILIEAMAAGTEVICSDIKGYRAVAHAQAFGLVAPQDVDGFVQKLVALKALNKPSRQQRRRMLIEAARPYSWDTLAEKFETLARHAVGP